MSFGIAGQDAFVTVFTRFFDVEWVPQAKHEFIEVPILNPHGTTRFQPRPEDATRFRATHPIHSEGDRLIRKSLHHGNDRLIVSAVAEKDDPPVVQHGRNSLRDNFGQ